MQTLFRLLVFLLFSCKKFIGYVKQNVLYIGAVCCIIQTQHKSAASAKEDLYGYKDRRQTATA